MTPATIANVSAPRSCRSTAVVVMGVSGCGKTTIGKLLAEHFGCEFRDADSFHPAANVAKMSAGHPLTDEDRWPWLMAIADWLDAVRDQCAASGTTRIATIVSCSALKRAYRSILIGSRDDVSLVYLKGDKALIGARMAARRHHFMPPSLLDSQFDALEEPGIDERPIEVSVAPLPQDIVAQILVQLGISARTMPATGDAQEK